MAANIRIAAIAGFSAAILSAATLTSAVSMTAGAANTEKPGAGLTSAVTMSAAVITSTPDSLVYRSLSELHTFTNWLQVNGYSGFIGEVGSMNQNDSAHQANWNSLMAAYLAECDHLGVATAQWAGGRVFSSTDPQAVLYSTTGAASADTEATNSPPLKYYGNTPIIHGLNMSGGEFNGPNGTSSGATLVNTTLYSNVNPGVNGTDYGYPVSADWTKLAGMGIKTVRLPFTWERLQPTLSGSLDSTALSALQSVVSAAASVGINIILDCHNYGQYYSGTSPTARTILFLGGSGATLQSSHLLDFWTKINTAFSSYGNVIAYDLMNEPAIQDNSGTYSNNAQCVSNWKTISQAVVSGLRTAGVTKTLIISGWWGSPPSTWVAKHGATGWITDTANNYFYTAHQYFDEASTSPGSGTYNNGGTYNYSVELALAVSQQASAALTAPVTLAAAAVRIQPAAATLTSAVTMSTLAVDKTLPVAALTSPVTMVSAAINTTPAAVTMVSPIVILAGFSASQAASANLTSAVTMVAAAGVSEPVSIALSSPVSLVAVAVRATSAASVFSSPVTISASATRVLTAGAALQSPTALSAVTVTTGYIRIAAIEAFSNVNVGTSSLSSPVVLTAGVGQGRTAAAGLQSPITIGVNLGAQTRYIRVASITGYAVQVGAANLNSPSSLTAGATAIGGVTGAALQSPVTITVTITQAQLRIASIKGWAIQATKVWINGQWVNEPAALLKSPVAMFALPPTTVTRLSGAALQSPVTMSSVTAIDKENVGAALSSPVSLTGAGTRSVFVAAALTSASVLSVANVNPAIVVAASLSSPVTIITPFVVQSNGNANLVSPVTMVVTSASISGASSPAAALQSAVTLIAALAVHTVSNAAVAMVSPVSLTAPLSKTSTVAANLTSPVSMSSNAGQILPIGSGLSSPVSLVAGIVLAQPAVALFSSPVTLTSALVAASLGAVTMSGFGVVSVSFHIPDVFLSTVSLTGIGVLRIPSVTFQFTPTGWHEFNAGPLIPAARTD